jgi:hypothetical protein
MKVLQVKRFPIYDIFQDEGWSNWTRIRVVQGRILHVAGEHIPIKELYSIMEKHNEHR